jgi:hypothetical protein
MENESLWGSKVRQDSEHAVVIKGGPCACFGGAEEAAHRLSDKLAKEAQEVRKRKLAVAMLALHRCHTKGERAIVLAPLYHMGLTPKERAPFIRVLFEQGLTEDEIVEMLWHVQEGACYEHALKECEVDVGIAESMVL